MASAVKVPDAGQTTSEFQVLRWSKEVGEEVKRGEVLFEIETDKAALEVECFRDGVLLTVLAPVGSLVSAGQIVAYVGESGETVSGEPSEVDSLVSRELPDSKEKGSNRVTPVSSKRILASPAARALAKKQGISLDALAAEAGQPIKKRDVETAGLAGEGSARYTDLPLTEFRRTIARRMTQSQRDIPQFSLEISVDLTDLEKHRKTVNEQIKNQAERISITDCLIVGLVRAVQEVPQINAQFRENSLRQFHQVNVGLAVATEKGLLVPVLRNAGEKSLKEVATARMRFVQQSREGLIDASSLTGATITLTNLGRYGIDRFIALVNPPEAAIVAVGRLAEQVVGRDGMHGLRTMAFLNGSFDHRVVDGAEAARFLQHLKSFLEEPEGFPW